LPTEHDNTERLYEDKPDADHDHYLYDNPDIAIGAEAGVEQLLDQIRDKSVAATLS
jgi:hypothetical protein